jgi:hypothetical protein
LKKFDNKVRQSVVDYITHIKREIDPIDDTWTYECIYVFTYCSEKSRLQLEPALREFGIELKSIESLYDELPEVVDQLKRLRVTHGFSKNENITVPQNIVVSYHLLRLLEHLGKT